MSSGINMIIENDMNQLKIVKRITKIGVRALSAYSLTRKRITINMTTASTDGTNISVRIILYDFF